MEQQKLIIDNRSTTPLYALWHSLFDVFNDAESLGFPDYTLYVPELDREFKVTLLQNRSSMTLRIEDFE